MNVHSVVTDLALKDGVREYSKEIFKKRDAQVSGEVDVKALVDSEVVTEQLEGDNVEQTLEAVDALGHAYLLNILRDTLITLIAYDDGLGLARGNLREGRLDLGVE